jgi:hypothetical protein
MGVAYFIVDPLNLVRWHIPVSKDSLPARPLGNDVQLPPACQPVTTQVRRQLPYALRAASGALMLFLILGAILRASATP